MFTEILSPQACSVPGTYKVAPTPARATQEDLLCALSTVSWGKICFAVRPSSKPMLYLRKQSKLSFAYTYKIYLEFD